MPDGHPDDDEMDFAKDSIRREREGSHDDTVFSENDTGVHAAPGHHGPWSNSGRIQGEGFSPGVVPGQSQLRLHP